MCLRSCSTRILAVTLLAAVLSLADALVGGGSDGGAAAGETLAEDRGAASASAASTAVAASDEGGVASMGSAAEGPGAARSEAAAVELALAATLVASAGEGDSGATAEPSGVAAGPTAMVAAVVASNIGGAGSAAAAVASEAPSSPSAHARSALLSKLAQQLRAAPSGGGGVATEAAVDLAADSLVLGLVLVPGRSESFYEEARSGEHLVGGLQAAGDDASAVELVILDPEGNAVERQRCAPLCLFDVLAGAPGIYNATVRLATADAREVVASFALGRRLELFARSEQLREMGERARSIEAVMLDAQQQWMAHWVRQQSDVRNLESLHTRVWTLGLLQLILIIAMQCFTTGKIAGMLADREPQRPPEPKRYSPSPSHSMQASRSTGLRSRQGLR